MDRRGDRVWLLTSTLSALAVLGPLLRPGDLLWRDAVFAPHPVLSLRLLGLTSETPRAVPSDAVVALLSHLLPAQIVGKSLIFAVLVLAGFGTARLVGRGVLSGSSAAIASVWNPYVAERLAMGQWALLVGYAALPWVLAGLAGWWGGHRTRRAFLGPLALGALGGAAGLVVLVVGVVGAGAARLLIGPVAHARRRVMFILTAVACCAVPWAVPALDRDGTRSDASGFSAFLPRTDLPFGRVASVLSGGGIWNAEAVPTGRDSMGGGLIVLLLLAVCLAGVVRGIQNRATRTHTLMALGAGILGLVVVLISSVPAVAPILASLPGGGLFRDGVRQSGPWVILLACGFGHAVDALPHSGNAMAVRWAAALLPVAAIPGMALALFGAISPATYPTSAGLVVSALNREEGPGSAIVLPYAAYRRYGWNGDQASLTPWSRMVNRPVLSSADLIVVTRTGTIEVAGEDPVAAAVGRALTTPKPASKLSQLGVGWVIIDDSAARPPQGATRVAGDSTISLWRLAAPLGSAVADPSDVPSALLVVSADAVAAFALAAGLILPAKRRPTRSASTTPTMR